LKNPKNQRSLFSFAEIYKTSCFCGKIYIEETGRIVESIFYLYCRIFSYIVEISLLFIISVEIGMFCISIASLYFHGKYDVIVIIVGVLSNSI